MKNKLILVLIVILELNCQNTNDIYNSDEDSKPLLYDYNQTNDSENNQKYSPDIEQGIINDNSYDQTVSKEKEEYNYLKESIENYNNTEYLNFINNQRKDPLQINIRAFKQPYIPSCPEYTFCCKSNKLPKPKYEFLPDIDIRDDEFKQFMKMEDIISEESDYLPKFVNNLIHDNLTTYNRLKLLYNNIYKNNISTILNKYCGKDIAQIILDINGETNYFYSIKDNPLCIPIIDEIILHNKILHVLEVHIIQKYRFITKLIEKERNFEEFKNLYKFMDKFQNLHENLDFYHSYNLGFEQYCIQHDWTNLVIEIDEEFSSPVRTGCLICKDCYNCRSHRAYLCRSIPIDCSCCFKFCLFFVFFIVLSFVFSVFKYDLPTKYLFIVIITLVYFVLCCIFSLCSVDHTCINLKKSFELHSEKDFEKQKKEVPLNVLNVYENNHNFVKMISKKGTCYNLGNCLSVFITLFINFLSSSCPYISDFIFYCPDDGDESTEDE